MHHKVFPDVLDELAERQGVDLAEKYLEGDLPDFGVSARYTDTDGVDHICNFSAESVGKGYVYRLLWNVLIPLQYEDDDAPADDANLRESVLNNVVQDYEEQFEISALDGQGRKCIIPALTGDHSLVIADYESLGALIQENAGKSDGIEELDATMSDLTLDDISTIYRILYHLGLPHGTMIDEVDRDGYSITPLTSDDEQ